MAKATTVGLKRLFDGEVQEFEVSHAENILKMKDSGWALPEGSEYEYKDGTLNRRSKKDSK
jgi:hypothetical protein